jgi:hypothetical protein
VSFAHKLVLNQWLLGLFNVKRFEDLAEHLRNEALEGLDENNVHHFHHALVAQLFNLTQLPTELLLEYDQNIVTHTQRLNERRLTHGEEPIVWKYFQYLTLLFTEIYLDRYFRDAEGLLQSLNAQVAAYNTDKSASDQIAPFDAQAEAWPQLNKLAYWSATGSGKTLLMHANILQYQYSYRYFYGDGFGKDYQILNLDDQTQQTHLEPYLVACLLAFFQQQRLYREQESVFRPFNLDKPLWIFVGGSVTKTLVTRDASDIIAILRFLARYVANWAGSIQRIERVLHDGLVTADGKNLFANRFSYLNTTGLSATQVFEETLATLFNAPGGGSLYVENLKGATGEIALRVGDNEPFGVINVGDDAKLVKMCDDYRELTVAEREFSGSLFHEINKPHSTVNLLIGSKKFTEGWNSWRVSTMGLMNVGATEGSQIIQLFGRGVRLMGHGRSLKRSAKTPLPEDVMRPKHIDVLETLTIFGIRADYMAQFRDFLAEEGLPTNDEPIEILLPVIKNLGTQTLKTIRLKKMINGVSTEFGDAFRKLGPIPTLAKPDPLRDQATEYLQRNQVILNWYPKIQALKSGGVVGGDAEAAPNQTHLTARHVAFLNLDRLYFELECFKAERGWHNLNLSREGLHPLLVDQGWYLLLIPAEEMVFDSFEKIRLWEEIALSLLKKYTERYYTFRKREWELPHLEYRDLEADDPNFLGVKEAPGDGYYRIQIENSQEEIVAKLKELKVLIEKGDIKPWEFRGMKAIWFGRHLYQPLLYLEQHIVEISPVPLNKGERQFVEDLKAFHDSAGEFFADKELYLLRNLSKGRGMGFFEAGNFHPDFILWLLIGGRQHVIFVDPKGIRNLGATDPKIQFHRTIKEIEQRLGNASVRLQSFIVSNTPSHTMQKLWNMDKPAMAARHILFQEEDKDTYVRAMLEVVNPAGTSTMADAVPS